ncbi:type I restriction enzyme HsdR N-terminal domain-containing protein [Nitrolancea hollandica]|uniref:Type I restriction enzyme R protein N-terminal domain-containing protein n=1 Tax=Nitrolancea hollandica Lb TaxID=1129897 RepID=I4ECW2_9BACT|nr:type I restriction enzyme HsdR N-terminal domain-containing protein [Nitrolancea hollandica]CCF82524.1 conserved hypothetical protein [Nitrolancea hollandica Lb]
MEQQVDGADSQKKVVKRSGPKWEMDTRERLRSALRKFSKPLADLAERDANEGDTRLLVTDFLCEGLGYDKYADLTTEYQVKGEFADYGVRIDQELIAFIEVKRVTTKLNQRHLRQVEMYAVNEGVEWVLLTNGARWQVYHLTGGLPIVVELALDVNLLGPESAAKKVDDLFYISREAFKRHRIDDLWKATKATSAGSLAHIIQSEHVLNAIRQELRRETGHRIETDELLPLLRETVIRPECLKN